MILINFKTYVMVVLCLVHQSLGIEYLDIKEDTNFAPCTINNRTLLCDALKLPAENRDKMLRFSKSNGGKIDKVELLNFIMNEIPENYFRQLSTDLLSIKVVSKSQIRTIHSRAFVDCKNVTFLEISGIETSDDFAVNVDNALSPLTSLQEVILRNLNIKNVTEGFFAHLPNLQSVTIDCLYFTSISTEAFRDNKKLVSLTFIGMKNPRNLITTLENWPSSSKLTIKSLSFSNCNLEKFPHFNDNVIGQLSHLSLAKSKIVEIGLDVAKTLTKLESLTLIALALRRETVPGLALMTNLKALKIEDMSSLTDLPFEIESMDSLEFFTIDMSMFDTISIALPSSIRKVSASYLQKSVDIHSNFLSRCNKIEILLLISLPTTSIQFLLDSVKVIGSSLNILSFDDTRVSSVSLLEFLGSLPNLETLYLNRANIARLSDSTLFNLKSLKRLMLSGNSFRYETINTAGFQNIARHLTYLDLSHNQLTQLPPCMFYSFGDFGKLNIQGNPFTCDCNMLWLHDVVKKQNIIGPRLNFTCLHGPNDGRPFYQLTYADLRDCPSSSIVTCKPILDSYYPVNYLSSYDTEKSVLAISNINGDDLRYIFDNFVVDIKQNNKSLKLNSETYNVTRRSIDIDMTLTAVDTEICLILNRDRIEYRYPYNCQLILMSYSTRAASKLNLIAAVISSVGTLVLIIIVATLIICRKCRLKRNKQHEYSEAQSSEYSEPEEKDHDQYTYVSSDHYSIDLEESFENHSLQSTVVRPSSTVIPRSPKLFVMPSSSIDHCLNSSKTSSNQQKSKFRQRHPIAELISKARSSSNIFIKQRNSQTDVDESFTMDGVSSRGSATLPRQYKGRALPQTPPVTNLEDVSPDLSPTKRRLSEVNIESLLNIADEHLSHFSEYVSNNSLFTDGSGHRPCSDASGMAISKVGHYCDQRLSDDASVII